MKDRLFRGLLCNGEAQFFLIDAKQMAKDARITHNCSHTATAALGRALMASAMVQDMEKDDENEVSLIINGGGPLGSIVCVGRSGPKIKGYIANPQVELPLKSTGKLDVGGGVGTDGTLTIIRDDKFGEPYGGSSELVSGEIAEDLAEYFNVSQQINSLVYLGVRLENDEVQSAAGFIAQLMPGHTEETILKLEQSASIIAGLSSDMAKSGDRGDIELWLNEKLSALEPNILAISNPEYSCDCSEDRIAGALITLGRTELLDIVTSEKETEIECHFCDKKYVFSDEQIQELADMAERE